MERKIDRRYGLKADEVRDAIIMYLKGRDVPYPKDGTKINYILGPHGATLNWTEESKE